MPEHQPKYHIWANKPDTSCREGRGFESLAEAYACLGMIKADWMTATEQEYEISAYLADDDAVTASTTVTVYPHGDDPILDAVAVMRPGR